MTLPKIVSVPRSRMEELQPLWRALYEHQSPITPHLDDRAGAVPFVTELIQRIEPDGRARPA